MQTTHFFPLSDKRNWILWKLETVNGRLSKVPYSAKYYGKASSTNPRTWTTFQEAKSQLDNSTFYDGLGFVFSEPDRLVFIDIDHCIKDRKLNDQALDIISRFSHSYVELSQSGEGIHIITSGTIPKALKNSELGVEMYSTGRYCAMTGNAVFPFEPHEEQAVIDAIYTAYKRPEASPQHTRTLTAPSLKMAEIIRKAMKSERFKELFLGNWQGSYPSQSEADLALCNSLAFWCDCDPELMSSVFSSSDLYREKWDRAYYRSKTIQTAITNCKETYTEYRTRKQKEAEDAQRK